MKLNILAIMVLCFGTMAFQNSTNKCSKFRKGKFESSLVKRNNIDAYISRPNDSVQIEYAEFGNKSLTSTFKIKWESDCVYTLYFVKAEGTLPTGFTRGDSIKVAIQKVISDERFAYRSSFKGQIVVDTFTRLK